jgi:spore maturation protein CgeB
MRFLVVHPGPAFAVSDVYDGWVEALTELGCSVAAFNLEDRLSFYAQAKINRAGKMVQALTPDAAAILASKGLEAACYEFLPDVVLVVSCFYIPLAVLDLCRARGSRVVILHLEEPYETDRELERAARADLNLINDPTHLDQFTAVAPTVYMPAAYRPAIHRPGPPDPAATSDFAFVGTGFPARVELLETVGWSGIDVALAGNWQTLEPGSPLRKFLAHDIAECCPNSETLRLYQSTKASMNQYRREISEGGTSEGWSLSPREVELAATGTFFLREARGEGDEVLPMLPTFRGPGDFEDQLRWWLAHDQARADVAAAARAATADRTFTSNARRLLELLG